MAAAPSPDRSAAPRARARVEMPDALRRDVRQLGELLGEVLREYGGQELLDDVERLRGLTISSHDLDPAVADVAAKEATALAAGFDLTRAEDVARAFTVYFHLVNLAEQQHRIRTLRERDRTGAPLTDALAGAVKQVAAEDGEEQAAALLRGLEMRPVLTAHPTEARRRAVVTTLNRVAELLALTDDPRLGESERTETRRRLLEEIDILWRTSALREQRPGPLDEVRTAMSVFDEVLFRVVPQIYRHVDAVLAGPRSGAEPSAVPAFIRFGSWIGGDRDGNPHVTAAVTREALAIQSDHILTGLETACGRIGRALTVSAATTAPSAAVQRLISDVAEAQPTLADALATRSPGEPHRVAMLLVAERLAATRRRDADLAYPSVRDFLADLRSIQDSLADAGAVRQAYGELQHLIWQAETFGFHLAELEVRQHSKVHAAALAEVRAGAGHSAQTDEVLATIRAIAQLQQRFGADACRRYVVSFTQSAEDLGVVYELAAEALAGRSIELDVVPLFETREDLDNCVDVLEAAVQLPAIQARLEATGRRFEVMLGYSDSAKDVGPVSATVALYDAQSRLVEWAERHDIKLTLFHGRGGALGRGGGPANRAVLAQAPGSVAGRFKVTEQGEVIFARYGERTIAHRHIEQVASAVLLASTPAVERRATEAAQRFADLEATLDAAARESYHRLVRTEGFAEWFATVTPLEELGALPIGSRPARRGLSLSSLEDLRAIPWVFAWAQTRANVPGWYGLGSGLAAVGDVNLLRTANAEWPLFTVLMENAEMSLAKTDRRILTGYLDLGGRDDLAAQVLDEHARTVEWVLRVTGHTRLLEDKHVLGWAVALRNPYVDALSHLQLRALRALRGGEGLSEGEVDALRRLLLITVNGVAAGLQNTG